MMRNGQSPKVLLFAVHPAPYQDGTFCEVARRRRVELHVAYLYPANSAQPYLSKGVDATYSHRVLDARRSGEGLSSLFGRVSGVFVEQAPDVVFVAGYAHPVTRSAISLALLRRKPLVMMGDSELKSVTVCWKRAVKAVAIRSLAGAARCAWVPGSAGREYWRKFGMSDARIFEGAYSLNTRAIWEATRQLRANRSTLRRNLGLRDDAFVILFVGRLVDQRGLNYLLWAFHEAVRRDPNLSLLVVGEGIWGSWMVEYVARERIRGVRMFRPVEFDELPVFYAVADAYIQPSTYEPYSLSTMQAAASALPIISTECVGAAYDVVDGRASGYIVASRSSGSLCDAMLRLSADRERSVTMGHHALGAALERSVDWAAMQFESAVTAALAGRAH